MKLKTDATFVNSRHRCQARDNGIKRTGAPLARRAENTANEALRREHSVHTHAHADGCLSVSADVFVVFVIQQDANPPLPEASLFPRHR